MDDDAEDKWTSDSNTTATSDNRPAATASQSFWKRVKSSHRLDEGVSSTSSKKNTGEAAQSTGQAKTTSTGKPEGTEPSGYVYSAPLCGLLTYPPRLISALQDFASKFPSDLLPINQMILATHLWMDIRNSPKFASRQSTDPIPDIPLACMILYYGHWLRWTHEMQLAEHPHPFPWVEKACATDLKAMRFDTGDDDLDQEEIQALMALVSAAVPGVHMLDRVRISPCCMPEAGNCGHELKPSKISLALSGVPDIHLMGLRTYDHANGRIGDNKFTSVSWPQFLDYLLYHPPIYKYPFAPHHRLEACRFMPQTWGTVTGAKGCWGFAVKPLPDVPTEPIDGSEKLVQLKALLSPDDYKLYIHQSRIHHEKTLNYIRDTGPCAFTTNANGWLRPSGMPPLTRADLTRPAPVALTLGLPPLPLARNVINPNETAGATIGQVAQSEEDPDMRQWKSPAGKVDSEAFDELLALWTAIPQGCHFAWYRGLELLKGSTREGVTTEDLLLFMNQLMERVRRDTGFIADIMSKALEGSVPGGEE